MIVDDEYVLRALEFRIKTKPYAGSLCIILNLSGLRGAMKYFDIWNEGFYITNPFLTIEESWFCNIEKDTFRIFIELVHHYIPPFTTAEIHVIMKYSRMFGYLVTYHNDRVTFRKEVYYVEDKRARTH